MSISLTTYIDKLDVPAPY